MDQHGLFMINTLKCKRPILCEDIMMIHSLAQVHSQRYMLIHYPEMFIHWFNKELFDYANDLDLIRLVPEHFDIWYDPNKINWTSEVIEWLYKTLNNKKDIWLPDYILHKSIHE